MKEMTEDVFEYVIVGAGPAGLQLGYFMEKAGRNYLILEANAHPGSFFAKFPRHRTLISINKLHTGSRSSPEFDLRHDWNSLLTDPEERLLMRDYSKTFFPFAGDYVKYLGDFAAKFSLRIRYSSGVSNIDRDKSTGIFSIQTALGTTIRCKNVVIATGLFLPQLPDIPGIELAEGYESMSIDPEGFAGQTVLILGKGNSAFETANNLLSHAALIHLASPHPVKLAWESHFVGHLRAINTQYLDTYLLKSQNGILDGDIRSIERVPSGKLRVRWSSMHTEMDEEIEQFEYDRVIRCTGFRCDDSIFEESCRPMLAHGGKVPQLSGAWESVNVPGMYFAGALMQTLDFKKSQSAFIHGFRYNVRTLFRILENRNRGIPLPHETVEITPRALAQKMIDRANETSSLWQQVGFLCDVIRLPEREGEKGEWYWDLNQAFVGSEEFRARTGSEYYVFMLKYGPQPANILNHPHTHPHDNPLASGDLTTEIHPVISRYSGSVLKAEYHVRTDFLTDWNSDFYREPLIEFLTRDLTGKDVGSKLAGVRRRELIRNGDMRLSQVRFDGRTLPKKDGSGAPDRETVGIRASTRPRAT